MTDAWSGVSMRWASAGDLPRLIELIEHGSLTPGKEQPDDLAPYQRAYDEITAGPGGLLVAEVDGQAVGLCQLIVFRHLQNRGGLCAEIESVHVHPSCRGQGIGHTLMRAVIEQAAVLGCYRVQLSSNDARADAHRFYESLGFVSSHRGFKLLLG
jgi:GNAT superfamily N-acetyltransferase